MLKWTTEEQLISVGVLVDSVVEVVNFSGSDIEPPPDALTADGFILGIGRRQNAPLCLLLDIAKLIPSGEIVVPISD